MRRIRKLWALVWIFIVPAAAGLVIEFAWAASKPDVTQGQFLYSWHRAFIFGMLALVIVLLWTAWGLINVKSRIKYANETFPWTQLIRNYQVSKLAAAWPMLLIVLYVAVGVNHLKTMPGRVGDIVRWINTKGITFDFLGYNFQAEDIFRLEFVGYLAGFFGFWIVRFAAPHWCRVRSDEEKRGIAQGDPRYAEGRALLADTITRNGEQIPARDLVFSLCDVRCQLGRKHPDLNWQYVDLDLQKASEKQRQLLDSEAREAAGRAVRGLPVDDAEPEAIARDLFDITRPKLRVGLGAWLLVAYLLVGLPIVARAAILLFPLLEKSPSQW